MLFFLLSVILMVSADKEISVTGFVKDDVVLPCDCSDKNSMKDFRWQMEADEKKGTKAKLIFKYNMNSNGTDNQFEPFLDKGSNDCSLLLKNITLDNEATYRCRFLSGTQYNRVFVTLKVCEQNICQYTRSTPGGGKVHHCDVKLDSYGNADIMWTLGGQIHLTNSPENNIFITSKNTSHHRFHSTLETNSTSGLEPKCEVSLAAGFYNSGTTPTPHSPIYRRSDPFLKMLCKVVPVVLILGFLLIWCRRRGPSHRLPSERDVENSDFSETSTNSDKLQNESILSSYPEEVINH